MAQQLFLLVFLGMSIDDLFVSSFFEQVRNLSFCDIFHNKTVN